MRYDTRRYLIAYDIPDDNRRTAIANALSAYGDRVQYSVFLVEIAPVRFARLCRQLNDLIEQRQDSILIADLGLATNQHTITWFGSCRNITDTQSFII